MWIPYPINPFILKILIQTRIRVIRSIRLIRDSDNFATLELIQLEKSDKMSLTGFAGMSNPRGKISLELLAHRKEENNGQNT